VGLGIGGGHSEEASGHAKLTQHHPASPPAQTAQDRQLQTVDRRSPDELQQVRQARPGQKTYGRQPHAFFRQPISQRIAEQHEGQARGKAERQH
jgi:hypothetical protein